MKTILILLLLAALALVIRLPIAGLGLALVAAVLLIGDLVGGLPESRCTHDCEQGDKCTCGMIVRHHDDAH